MIISVNFNVTVDQLRGRDALLCTDKFYNINIYNWT